MPKQYQYVALSVFLKQLEVPKSQTLLLYEEGLKALILWGWWNLNIPPLTARSRHQIRRCTDSGFHSAFGTSTNTDYQSHTGWALNLNVARTLWVKVWYALQPPPVKLIFVTLYVLRGTYFLSSDSWHDKSKYIYIITLHKIVCIGPIDQLMTIFFQIRLVHT